MERFKNAIGTAAGFLLVLVFLSIPVIFLLGAAEFSLWALEWVPSVIGFAIFASVLLIPLALIPATRGFSSSLFGIAYLVFGACLWLYALAITYIEWGMLGVVIGVLIFGVGVIFTGVLAAIFSATWAVLGNLAFMLALFFVARIVSTWLGQLADQRHLRNEVKENPSRAMVVQDETL